MKIQQLESKLSAFNTEEAAARSMFGQETDSFFKGQEQSLDTQEMNVREKIVRLKVLLENGNLSASGEVTAEYNKLVEHKKFIDEQIEDLKKTGDSLEKLIIELSEQIDVKFREGLEKINSAFARFFKTLFSSLSLFW